MKTLVKIRWVLIPLLSLVVVGGAGVYWFMLRNNSAAPLALRTESALSRPASSADISGQWTVVPGTGVEATTVGYRVNERVFGVGADTATGRTHNVTGSVTVMGQRVTSAQFTVDMATLKSNKSLRDSVLRTTAIQTNKFPTAAFTLTAPIALPEIAVGKVYQVDARGRLQLHGVSKSVSVTLHFEQTKTGFDLLVDMPIVMADYSITPPNVAGIVSVDNHGSFELLANLARSSSGSQMGKRL